MRLRFRKVLLKKEGLVEGSRGEVEEEVVGKGGGGA